MGVEYDTYYQTENLFGDPYPELIDFYSNIESKGRLLDLGCGQGRDAIALARLGYEVIGLDYSQVGINQLNAIAQKDNLSLTGIVGDIYMYSDYSQIDFILLNSMFHFGKNERLKEQNLLKRIIDLSSPNTIITICIQNTGKKTEILQNTLSEIANLKTINRIDITFIYEDPDSDHRSTTPYEIISIQKQPS